MSRGCWRAAGGRGFCAGWGRGVSFQILRGCRFVLCVVLFRWRKAGEKLEKARVKLEKVFFVLMFVSRVVETREDQPGGGVVVTR